MRSATIAILYLLLFLGTACSGEKSCGIQQHTLEMVDSLWQKDFSNAQELVENFTYIKGQLSQKDSCGNMQNLCQYIWNSGEYMFRCRGKNEDIQELTTNLDDINLDNGIVKSFMIERDTARFVDHFYTLRFMKEGCSFEESRDGITITVFYRPRSMNGNDYTKMREVFQSHNDALHIAYMKKLKFPFRNSGCNEEFYAVRPLIEQNVKESTLKSEILALFDIYSNVMPGETAATPVLKDINGNGHTFAEFHGKVLVIDVWATWCSSCLAGMPKYMALRSAYKENNDIEFITVSIDRKENRENWLAAIAKRKMGDMLNLYPDCSFESQFESEYHISGVPRYIIIDKQGKIVTAYAPPPGEGMEAIIENTIK